MPDPAWRREQRGNNPLHPLHQQIHTDTTTHKFYICIFEIRTHYPFEIFISLPAPLYRPPPPLHPSARASSPVSSCHSSSLHPFCPGSLLGVSGGKRGPVDNYPVRPFHVFSRRPFKLPRFSAAAGSEFLTLAFHFASRCCVLSLHFGPKNLGVQQLSWLIFFFFFF